MQIPKCNTWPAAGTAQTLFSPSDVPATRVYTDGSRYALGLRVSVVVAGDLTAVRFLKAVDDGANTHLLSIVDWNTGQEYYNSRPIDDSSCAGSQWVSVPVVPPLRLAAGTVYLIYFDR